MGTRLHQALRTLCFNTDWKYAVFWKLERRARLTLTWEDAYYENSEECGPLENNAFSEIGSNLCYWYSHDPLRLSVVKMSDQVYSLGEGVIGQVAATGKHMWIFADKQTIDSCLPFECFGGFQHSDALHAQFSAGIRTVAVMAIIPHGVVQLGSLNKIPEDFEMVNHIRDSFFALQDPSVACNPRDIYCTMRSSSCQSDISTTSTASGVFSDRHRLSSISGPINKDKKVFRAPTFPSIGKPVNRSYIVPVPGNLPQKAAEAINKNEGIESLASGGDESAILLQSRAESFLLEQMKPWTRLHSDRHCEVGTSGLGNQEVGLFDPDVASSNKSFKKDSNCNVILPATDFGVDITYLQADLLDSSTSNNRAAMSIPKAFGMRIQRDLENSVFHTESNKIDAVDMPFKFSAGCELYEVLGPVFQQHRSHYNWGAEKTETETAVEIPEGVDCSSLLTENSCSEQLLEAVVAKVCCGVTGVKSEKSFSESLKSQLTTLEMLQPIGGKLTVGSAGDSFDQSLVEKEALCFSSETCGVSSSKGFSSRSQSMFSGQLDSAVDPGKINKKRARPGENCRPRPRDRQLIQDRIKELRELVPNGSKCSIDSLLERTIKHMMFMQSITKHAEKLNKCTKEKVHDKETVLRDLPSYDHGSTWAVEVGSLMEVCPIMVENITKNGQMLIEMLCEECCHFLVIAEAIRSLGLTILKGATEACGKKTLMCFVVEGQNNRSMHRMDILWSLVHILQSKTTI